VHEPVSAPRPREAEQPAPAAEPSAPAKTAPPAPAKSAASSARGNREFLALPASDYVIELAHSANAADFAALRASLQPTRGQLYELHLRRDNGDWWLLVWGSFDSVDAARGARAELPADAAINAGWPRRIGALQSEARRVSPNQD
jgi:septal ring-binding cell division protein DamX